MKKYKTLIIFILVPLVLGALVGLITVPKSNVDSLIPSWIFPIVWTILYILMGISIGLILLTQEIKKSSCLLLFLLQLGLNFAWSFFFFYLENPAYGTVIILLLDVVVFGYTYKAYQVKKVSAYLFYPYIAWLFLATYLNLYIFVNN